MCVTVPLYSVYMNRTTRIPCLVRDAAVASPVDAITTPGDAVALLDSMFHASLLAEEHLYMIAMDPRGRPLAAFDTSHGDPAHALARPREILLRALLAGASAFVVAHNHPTGIATPSEEDKQVTRAIVEAGRLIGIPCVDHVIIGSEGFYSMRNSSTLTVTTSPPPLLDESEIPST